MVLTSEFAVEKGTKNTVRLTEVARQDGPPIANTIYLQRWVLNQFFDPGLLPDAGEVATSDLRLKVTVELGV